MKKLSAILCSALLCVISACSPDGGLDNISTKYSVGGAIQKGPFVQGSSITIQTLNGNLKPSGQMYTTQTINDAGQFELDGINSKYVEIIANGYYFDEVLGSVSNAPLTMRSIADLKEEPNTNVNLITTLVYPRIKQLADGGKSIAEAGKQAERELYSALGISEENFPDRSSGSLNIAENGEGNGLLIAVSVVLQCGRSVGELSELIAKLSSDLADDGQIGDKLISELPKLSDYTTIAEDVEKNLNERYESLDVQSVVPEFHSYLTLYNDIDDDGVLDVNEFAMLSYDKVELSPMSEVFILPLLTDVNKCEISVEEGVDWVVLNISDGVCNVSVAENDSDIKRTAAIVLKDKNSDSFVLFTIEQQCVGGRIYYTYAPNLGDVCISTDAYEYSNRAADGKGEILLDNAPTVIDFISGPITGITIPDSVTSIEGSVFAELELLEQFGGKYATEDGKCLIVDRVLKAFVRKGVAEYVIPENVISIDRFAFAGSSSLTSVTINKGITNISDYAFFNCIQLTTIDMRGCITPPTLGKHVFSQSPNLSIHIPEEAAWDYICAWDQKYYRLCPTLANYDWTQAPSDHIVRYTTANGQILARVALDNVLWHSYSDGEGMIVLSEPLTTITTESFYQCTELATLTLPACVVSVGNSAFTTCESLASITFTGSTPPSLGVNVFITESNVAINIPEDAISNYLYCDWDIEYKRLVVQFNSLSADDFDPDDKIFYTTSDNQKLDCGFDDEAFWHEYKDGVGCIAFLSPITSIGDRAFRGCDKIKSITIPASVTSIGYASFEKCYSLEEVTLPDNLTSIGEWAFLDDINLKAIDLPNGVVTIRNNAFHGCKKIESIVIPEGVTKIESGTFYDCAKLSSVTLPEGITSIGNDAFCLCASLTSITIPNSVTSIGEEAFVGCTNLKNVVVGSNITEVGTGAFKDCSNLSQFSGGVASSDGRCLVANGQLCAFAPYNICEYTIPSGVVSIGAGVFKGCSNLTNVSIPSGVVSIGESAFSGCSSLANVTIPGSVTEIGAYAFSGLSGSSPIKVYCKPTTPPEAIAKLSDQFWSPYWEWNAFDNESSCIIYVPFDSVEAYKNADYWSDYADAFVGYTF